jgi:hypothetical protein
MKKVKGREVAQLENSKPPAKKKRRADAGELTVRKALALAMIESGRYSWREVQARTGLSNDQISALKRGDHNVPAVMVRNLRDEEPNKMTLAMHRLLDALLSKPDTDLRKLQPSALMIPMGILNQNRRLIEEKPTQIIETRLKDDVLDQKIEEQKRRIRELGFDLNEVQDAEFTIVDPAQAAEGGDEKAAPEGGHHEDQMEDPTPG